MRGFQLGVLTFITRSLQSGLPVVSRFEWWWTGRVIFNNFVFYYYFIYYLTLVKFLSFFSVFSFLFRLNLFENLCCFVLISTIFNLFLVTPSQRLLQQLQQHSGINFLSFVLQRKLVFDALLVYPSFMKPDVLK